MKKTLIFCFDGTYNDPEDAEDRAMDGSVTNILKLHILFRGDLSNEAKTRTDDGSQQRSFYYSGAGTYGGPLRRFFNMAFAPKNADVRRILNDAIEDLKMHYEEGNHILVFGVGGGAVLARRFASVAKERSEKKDLEIDFLGVFDTVAAISSRSHRIRTDLSVETRPTSDVVFENGRMSQIVKKAVHLVALDENRVAFQPTLFNHDDSGRITEVWFPGVHSDVGGGHWYDGLSDLALDYMVKKIRQKCVGYVQIIDPKEVDYVQLNDKDDTQITEDDINIKASVNGVLHEHKRTIARKATLHSRKVRIAGNPPEGVYPMVHASVQRRYEEVTGYRPHALRGVKYILTSDDDQVSKVREGALGLEVE